MLRGYYLFMDLRTRREQCLGTSIWQAAEVAKQQAQYYYEGVEFVFNGIELCIHPDSNPNDIAFIYALKNEIRRLSG